MRHDVVSDKGDNLNDLSCLGTDIKRIDSRKREKEWNRATSDKVTKVRHVRSDSDSVLPYTFHCYGKSTSGMMCDVSNKSIFIPKHSRYSYANVPKKQDTVSQVKVKPSSHCVTLSMEKPEITHSEWVISQFLLASSPAWNFKRNPVSLPFIPRYSETYLDRDTLASQNTHLIGEKEDYSQYIPGHLHVLSSARDYSQYLTSSVPPQMATGGDRRDLNTLIWVPPLGIEKEMEGAEPGEILPMNPFSSALVAPTETSSSASASVSPANPPSLKSEQLVENDVWHNDMYLSYLDETDPYSMIPSRVRSHRSHRKHQRHHKSTLSETKESTESTSQSDLEEESANLKKLRDVSHRWRKRERWLESLPSEEGEVPLSEMKISFFKREGIDIKSLSKEEALFLETLERRHQEKWNVRHGKTPTENYITSLKEQILQVLHSSASPTQKESEEEKDPLKEAEQQQQMLEQLQQRRRVLIPFQPAPDVIYHKYYPPDVYLRYTFVLSIQDDEPTAEVESRLLRESDAEESQDKQLGNHTVNVKGYKSWTGRATPSRDIKEQALPESTRKQLEEVRLEETKAIVRLQRANSTIERLKREIEEKERQLQNDKVVISVLLHG